MIKNRLVAYLFASSYKKIEIPIKNKTSYLMPLDLIIDDKQRFLFKIVIQEFNKYL